MIDRAVQLTERVAATQIALVTVALLEAVAAMSGAGLGAAAWGRAILLAVAQALEAAHEQGIVHRDVKPGNVFLRKDGAIKLGDFGIARIDGLDLTETGMCVGTPRYMAPEQACGQSVDGRADVYALGVMAYRMLTGRPPFVGGDLAYQHVHATPPDPREFNPDLPPLLAQLLLGCLAKKPSRRPPSAGRFAVLLQAACQASPVGA